MTKQEVMLSFISTSRAASLGCRSLAGRPVVSWKDVGHMLDIVAVNSEGKTEIKNHANRCLDIGLGDDAEKLN